MAKITFMGAGSTVFAKNVLGDCMTREALKDSDIALYDIDAKRLNESKLMLETLNHNINADRATIKTYLGVAKRKQALRGADFVVNAIQVGGYQPSTEIDFEIPKRYGLRQTIADTLGIGGIFRALRTIPVMLEFAHEMEEVCPKAWMLSYTNPMCMLSAAMLRGSAINYVGLCHSVQGCAQGLLSGLGFSEERRKNNVRWKIAGINHMAWLLEITENGKDLYPEIKKIAAKKVAAWRADKKAQAWDMVRLEIMRHFGHYVTESSEHNAEYTPYWIKARFPELIEEFRIPLDEYPRRCVNQIADWNKRSKEMVGNPALTHERTHEYGSQIIESIYTNTPSTIHGNILNHGFITNLPSKAAVEVPCLVDGNGVQGCYVGELPEQLAGLNRTNINAQIMAVDAALTLKREHIYHAAMLDPHTAAELTLDQIRSLCDDLIAAHGDYLPKYH